ncbi:MAG: tryptophan synthase subunit alpha, partial [Acidimicrobiales bacterium]
SWIEVAQAMAAAGADAIEVGIPFSDPVMDGPTIQEASLRALQGGATPQGILAELSRADIGVPLVAMTYYNLVFRGGHRRFASALVDARVAGIILPDLPLEELDDWSRAADDAGVETVQLAAPITPDDRLRELCRRSRGFLYGVNLMGVTGERAAVARSAQILGARLKAATDKPVLMGFGISTPAQAAEVAAYADGVIVASALMRVLLEGGTPDAVGERVAAIRAALDALPPPA